jgi:ribosome-associated protein
LWFTASTSGGPGGQHVNKVSTKVTLFWNINETEVLNFNQRNLILSRLNNRISKEGILSVSSDEYRSQHRNRTGARERLVALLENALKPVKKRVPTKISKSAIKRRLNEKKKRSLAKQLRQRPHSNID